MMPGVAAFPFQLARRVGLGRDEPKRGAVIMRCADPLAPSVEHQSGDAGGMGQFLQHPSGLIEQPHDLAGARRDQSLAFFQGIGGDMFHPFHAETGNVGNAAIGGHAPQLAVIAAGDETIARRIGGKIQHRAIMHRGRNPVGVAAHGRDAAPSRRQARSRRACHRGKTGRPPRTRPTSRDTPRELSRKAASAVWLMMARSLRSS